MSGSALPPERPGRDAAGPLLETRRRIDQAVAAGVWSTGTAPVAIVAGGVSALRFDPPRAPRATIVHFHGGAFRIGRPEQVAPFAARLACATGATILCPRYRLAPEHPFPAAVNDGIAVLDGLPDPAGPLILSGDSAGGGLAAAVTAALVAGRSPPSGLVLLSAWLDLRVCSDGYRVNAASDPLFSREAATEAAALYLQGAADTHPAASPLLGGLEGFPPTLLCYGSGEVLAQDSAAFAAALERAGSRTRVLEVAGMDHVAVTRGADLPGAQHTFDAIVDFVAPLVRDHAGLRAVPG